MSLNSNYYNFISVIKKGPFIRIQYICIKKTQSSLFFEKKSKVKITAPPATSRAVKQENIELHSFTYYYILDLNDSNSWGLDVYINSKRRIMTVELKVGNREQLTVVVSCGLEKPPLHTEDYMTRWWNLKKAVNAVTYNFDCSRTIKYMTVTTSVSQTHS